MNMSLFYTGIKLGLIVALPVGPITLICIRQSLGGNFIASVIVAAATGTANIIYTLVGALSLSTINHYLNLFEKPIELFGGAIILAIGINSLLHNKPNQTAPKKTSKRDITKTYFSILLLSITSPMTITLFATGFAGLEPTQTATGYGYLGWLTSGVVCASIGWLLFLSSTILFCRRWLSIHSIVWINSIASSCIILYALQRLYSVFF